MFGGQAVLRNDGLYARGFRQPGGEMADRAGAAELVAAPMEIKHQAARPGRARAQPLGPNAAEREFGQPAAGRERRRQAPQVHSRALFGERLGPRLLRLQPSAEGFGVKVVQGRVHGGDNARRASPF